MKILRFLFAAAVGASSLAASAQQAQQNQQQSPLYGSVGIVISTYKETAPGVATFTAKPKLVIATLGSDIHPNLAIEGSLGLGVGSSKTTYAGQESTTKIKQLLGVYLKPQYKMDAFKVYGKLGTTYLRNTVSTTTTSLSSSGASLSYGAGMSYDFSPEMSAYLEYMSYYNRKASNNDAAKVKIQGFNAGLEYRF